MPQSAAEISRDRLIEHDIDMRRFIAGHEKEINEIMRRMESRIDAKVAEIDVPSARGPRSRERRLEKLQKAVNEITKEAYAEIRRKHREAQMVTVRATSRAIITAIEEAGDIVS